MRASGGRISVVALLLVVGVVPAVPAVAGAQERPRTERERDHRGMRAERPWAGLGLSEEQRDRLRELRQRFREENADALERARRMRTEIRESRRAGDRPSREEIAAIAERHGNPLEELRSAREAHQARVHEVLTPEQRDRLEARMRELRERRGEGHRRGREGRHPEGPRDRRESRPPR